MINETMEKSYKKLVLIGAGGHAKVCYDIAQKMEKWSEIIVLDDNSDNDYFDIAGSLNDTKKYVDDSDFFVAIGDNETRMSMTKKLNELDASIVKLIHPQATIASNVTIEEGTVIMAGVVMNSATEIGKGCIINTSSSIDHDNIIGDFVHISPGVHLGGTVIVGEKTWIGIGANIINNLTIGRDITIGAGSLVIDSISKSGTYIGVPAKMKG